MNDLEELINGKPVFHTFEKIARVNRPMIVTEKLDGQNALIHILDDGRVFIGSREQYIDEHTDVKGFWHWCQDHMEEIKLLGPGRHHGEWWGSGIGRGYGLKEKHFSLFNTSKWNVDNTPPCVDVVPVLYQGPFSTETMAEIVEALRAQGSMAVPGFMRPEGIVVFHVHAYSFFKWTLENDDVPKSSIA